MTSGRDVPAAGAPASGDDGRAPEPAAPARKSVFISYARQDHERVRQVAAGLRVLASDVWLDESLVAGEAWWEEILEHIRTCDVFVQTLSPAALRSPACDSERDYAVTLRKPILPVALERVPSATLPSDLAGLQFVDYTEATADAAFRLARALDSLKAAPALPEPLPTPPPVPFSYLVALGDKTRTPQGALTLDDQLAIAAQLRGAIDDPDDVDAAESLLRDLRSRRDLFAVVGVDVDKTLAEIAARRRAAGDTGSRDVVTAGRRDESSAERDPPAIEERHVAASPRVDAPEEPASTTDVSPHWAMAVIAAILLVPVGVFAVVSAARVRPALERGDVAAAERASSRVRTLFWVTVVLFVALVVLVNVFSSEMQSSA